jgi:hypothetical protein
MKLVIPLIPAHRTQREKQHTCSQCVGTESVGEIAFGRVVAGCNEPYSARAPRYCVCCIPSVGVFACLLSASYSAAGVPLSSSMAFLVSILSKAFLN